MFLRQLIRSAGRLFDVPSVSVDLMYAATAGNDPFYGRIVHEFYRRTRRRHRKFPLFREYEYGVALCRLPSDFETYFMTIEASARRNWKKAERNGYRFDRIDYNDCLDDIKAIRCSTDTRQGNLPREFLQGAVVPCRDPASLTQIHDYPYFGVLRDNQLVAYAGGLVSGEIFMMEQIYGHAEFQAYGIVPMLIVGIAGYIPANYPSVKYYAYGTYFGARPAMKRFKRKFGFRPHRVKWELG